MRSGALILTTCALCAGPGMLAAQMLVPRDEPRSLTAAQCSSVTRNVTNNPARLDTLALLRFCRSFGPTIVSLLRSPSVYADSGTYDAVVVTAGRRIEAPIFDYAFRVARDPRATVLQRVVGVHLMLRYITRSPMEYDRRVLMLDHGPDGGCLVGGPTDVPTVDAGLTPLPAGAGLAAYHLADTLVRSPATPNQVLFYARCLGDVAVPLSVQAPWMAHSYEDRSFTPALHFEFEVLCARRVLVRNRSRAWLSLRLVWGADSLEVEDNDQARPYNVRPRPRDAAFHQEVWQVPGTAARKFRIQQVITMGNIPPYVVLAPMESLDTAPCP